MTVAKRLEGINEYYFSQKLREIEAMNKAGKAVINLGIGSPDLPPHPEVIRILQEESIKPNNHAYQSYKGSAILRNAIAAWYLRQYGVGVDPETEILPLIGSKEGIMHVCMTYLDAGDAALVPNPGYPTYKSAVELAGGTVLSYDLTAHNNWMANLDVLQQTISSYESQPGNGKVKLMFVNYPHMPTGQLPLANTFDELVAFASKHDLLLVNDNPYSFILNKHPQSMLSSANAKNNIIELNSLSKSHNMAGWRVGMLIGAKERIAEVLTFKSNMDSGMFLPLQLAAAKALELGEEWHNELNAVYRQRQQLVFELLDLLECNFSRSQAGMFVWAAIPPSYDSGYQLSDEVLKHANVFITPGGIFGTNGNGYIRVSLCSPVEKISSAINRIKQINK
jgi:aspartate/methionine/tyrosine aminotransferase